MVAYAYHAGGVNRRSWSRLAQAQKHETLFGNKTKQNKKISKMNWGGGSSTRAPA
jgi:hypothetical protein